MMVGEHEWRGRHYRYTPDPYGRWILAATVLPHLEDGGFGSHASREAAAGALHRLAQTSGRNGAAGGSPVYDPLIAQLREAVPADARPAWDLLAPPSERLVPDMDGGRRLADALTDTGLRLYPEMDPRGRLDSLRSSVILLHGRSDSLVPFTETLRLAALLPVDTRSAVTITRLIGHSRTSEAASLWKPLVALRETQKLVRAMRRIENSVNH